MNTLEIAVYGLEQEAEDSKILELKEGIGLKIYLDKNLRHVYHEQIKDERNYCISYGVGALTKKPLDPTLSFVEITTLYDKAITKEELSDIIQKKLNDEYVEHIRIVDAIGEHAITHSKDILWHLTPVVPFTSDTVKENDINSLTANNIPKRKQGFLKRIFKSKKRTTNIKRSSQCVK